MKSAVKIAAALLLCSLILSGCQSANSNTSTDTAAPQESGENTKRESPEEPEIRTITDIPAVTDYDNTTGVVKSNLELSSGVELQPFRKLIQNLSSFSRENDLEIKTIIFDDVTLDVEATETGFRALSVNANETVLVLDTPIDLLGKGENDRCFSIVTSQNYTVVSTDNGLRHYFLDSGKVTVQDFSGNLKKDFRIFFKRSKDNLLNYMRFQEKYLENTTPEQWIYCCNSFDEEYCEEGSAWINSYECEKVVTMESHREAMEQAFESKKDSDGKVIAANGTVCKTLSELISQNPITDETRFHALSEFMNEEQIQAYRLALLFDIQNLSNIDTLHVLVKHMNDDPLDRDAIDEEKKEYLQNFRYPDGLPTAITKNGYEYYAVKSVYHTMKDFRALLGQAFTEELCDETIGTAFIEENGYLYSLDPAIGPGGGYYPSEYPDTYLLLYQDENELRFLRIMNVCDPPYDPVFTLREHFGVTVMKKTEAGWRVDVRSGY